MTEGAESFVVCQPYHCVSGHLCNRCAGCLIGFTELAALNCENNQLTALDVSKNTHLSEIYCGGNQLATLDLTGLPIKDAETDTGHVQTLPGKIGRAHV